MSDMPNDKSHANPSAVTATTEIWDAFLQYRREFGSITRRARRRFEDQDWAGMQADARRRLDVYSRQIGAVVYGLREMLGPALHERSTWIDMKQHYGRHVALSQHYEVAMTFFNSVTRRIFSTIGVDPQIEFVNLDLEPRSASQRPPVHDTVRRTTSTTRMLAAVLRRCTFRMPFAHLDHDAEAAARAIDDAVETAVPGAVVRAIEMLRPLFFRGQRAFLVGRMQTGAATLPLVLALVNTPEGIVVDAALARQDDVSILFSFTRSYFHVNIERPADVVAFLKSTMPRKRTAELYISLGYDKHGKTALYDALLRHLAQADDRFEIAKGEPGLVMVVFTLQAFDVVFKIIRDRFPPPKNTTREEVMAKYRLVFRRDRAGRLVDAQEFEHLTFDRALFTTELLEELLQTAANTVSVTDQHVHITHLYMERRMTPLNLYLRDANEPAAAAAVIDYGQAIKDLAATNIFPGDLLIKNFGVTRHGRVIFYDYDELCLLGDCNFRRMPSAATIDDEMSAEPWFYVGPSDVFPEEFGRFLGLAPALRAAFDAHHADLLTAAYWTRWQEVHTTGEVTDICPYAPRLRLHTW